MNFYWANFVENLWLIGSSLNELLKDFAHAKFNLLKTVFFEIFS